MKKIWVILIASISLTGCFEEVDNSLDRDDFIGNYNFTLTCSDNAWDGTHIIFIEKPISGNDSLKSTIIIRNLLNQNNTIEAVVSDKDMIFNDNYITGTGTLDTSTNTISLNFSFGSTDCSGSAALRK